MQLILIIVDMKSNRVGVLLPMYNVSNYIEECLASWSAQTYEDLTLFLVDDGSTDATLDIVDRVLADAGVDYVVDKHGNNRGWAYAMNTSANRAIKEGAEYLFIANADDWVERTIIEECMDEIKDSDWVYMPLRYDTMRVQPSQSPTIEGMLQRNQLTNFALIRSHMWTTLGGYDVEVNGGNGFEDWDFWIRALKAGFKPRYLNRVLYHYRKHAKQTSRGVPKSAILAIKQKHQ